MDSNPYESPQVAETGKKAHQLSTGRIMLAILLGLMTLPAAAIAFFATCAVTMESTGFNSTAPWIVGTIGGLTAAAVMIFFTVRTARRSAK